MSYDEDNESTQIKELKEKIDVLGDIQYEDSPNIGEENATGPTYDQQGKFRSDTGTGSGGSGFSDPLTQLLVTLIPAALPSTTLIDAGAATEFQITLDKNIEFNFTGGPPSGRDQVLTFFILQDAIGGYTINWGTKVTDPPIIGISPNESTTVVLVSRDQGVSWVVESASSSGSGEFFGPWTADHNSGEFILYNSRGIFYDETLTKGISLVDGGVGIIAPTGDTIDFFINDLAIPKFGITETSIESNVEFNLNSQDVIGVDRLSLVIASGVLDGVANPTIYLTAGNEFVFNNNASSFIWSHTNTISMIETTNTLEKRDVIAPNFNLTNTRNFASGTTGTIGFYANTENFGSVAMAFLIANSETATDDGTGSLQIGVLHTDSNPTNYIFLNDGNSGNIDLLQDVDFKTNDAINIDRIILATSSGSGIFNSSSDTGFVASIGGDLMANAPTDNGHFWKIQNIDHMSLHGNDDTILALIAPDNGAIPKIQMFAFDATPIINSQIGMFDYLAKNDAGDNVVYGSVRVEMEDDAENLEDGGLSLYARRAGNITAFMTMNENGDNKITAWKNLLFADSIADIELNGNDIYFDNSQVTSLTGTSSALNITVNNKFVATISEFEFLLQTDVGLGNAKYVNFDPTTTTFVLDGTMWVDDIDGKLKLRENGVIYDVIGSGVTDLDDLTDITISLPGNTGDILRYTGANWVNTSIQSGDLPDTITGLHTFDGTVTMGDGLDMDGGIISDTVLLKFSNFNFYSPSSEITIGFDNNDDELKYTVALTSEGHSWYAATDRLASIVRTGTDQGELFINKISLDNLLLNNQFIIFDSATNPGLAGEFRVNGSDVLVYSGGSVRNLSDIGSGGGGTSSSIVDGDSNFSVVDGVGFTWILDNISIATMTSTTFLLSFEIDMSGFKIIDLGYPTTNTDAASMQYVLDQINGISSETSFIGFTADDNLVMSGLDITSVDDITMNGTGSILNMAGGDITSVDDITMSGTGSRLDLNGGWIIDVDRLEFDFSSMLLDGTSGGLQIISIGSGQDMEFFVDSGYEMSIDGVVMYQSAGNFTDFGTENDGLDLVINGPQFGPWNFAPIATGFTGLGHSGQEWLDVWAVDGTINNSFSKFKKEIEIVPTADCLAVCDAMDVIKWKWDRESLVTLSDDPIRRDLQERHLARRPEQVERVNFGYNADVLTTMCPEAIKEDGVYERSVIGLLLGSIKELNAKIKVLEAA